MNAIDLLKEDHRSVEQLFSDHERAGDGAFAEKKAIAERIFKALEVHTQIEEEAFYPATRDVATSDETQKLVAEAYEEHQVAKNLIAELKRTAPEAEQWDARMKVLKEAIEHHVEEEEGELFPQAREALGAEYLAEMGVRMAERKKQLTTTSPGISGSIVKLVSKAYDSLTGNGKTTARKTSTGKSKTKRSARKSSTAKRAVTKTKRAARSVATRATGSKKTRAARSTMKKVAASAKSRVKTGRARAAKTVKTARKRTTKAARSARR